MLATTSEAPDARGLLSQRAHRRTARIPGDLLVEHALSIVHAPDLPLRPDRASSPPSSPDSIRALFSRVSVKSTPGAGLSIEAPPEATATLAALLEGVPGRLRREGPR